MNFLSAVLPTPADLPPAPSESRLRISAFTAICYFAHCLDSPTALDEAFREGLLREVDHPCSYKTKYRHGSGLRYTSLIDAGPVPVGPAASLGSTSACRLRQSLLTFGHEYALSAVPIVVTTAEAGGMGIRIDSPLSIDDLLRFLLRLEERDTLEAMAANAADGVSAAIGVAGRALGRTWVLPNQLALQLWDLGGTAGRDVRQPYDGVRESAEFAWEIAAILSYNSDRLLDRSLWRQLGPQQVYHHVQSGRSFFDDHMVFMNGACCLEITHSIAHASPRSQFRWAEYGYDSSSILVWTVAAFRAAIVDDLRSRYRRMITTLTERRSLSASEQAEQSRLQMNHAQLLDRIVGFQDLLVEERNRALDQEIARRRAGDRPLQALTRVMEKTQLLSQSLERVHDEAERARRTFLLTALGIALAALQMPSFVAQVGAWLAARNWLEVGVSAVLILAPLLVAVRFWERPARR